MRVLKITNCEVLLIAPDPGLQISYNAQVDHHRDGHNSTLYDSVMSVGENYVGGRWIFADLGVSLCGDHGYSVHGAFKTLIHGVSHILPGPDLSKPPLRMAAALYSHSDVFAGAARFSAKEKNLGSFSDSALWLPFFPANVSVGDAQKLLLKEYKDLGKMHRFKKWQKKHSVVSLNS